VNRRLFLKSAVAAGLSQAEAAASQPTNVLFILADQWRSTAFSHGTDPVVKTPNHDRLVSQAARFSRMYAANPVCTPNRSCILTSRYSHQHGMTHNNIMLPPKEKSIADMFSLAGYATHYIGKWHMDGREKPGFVPPGWRRRGFQTFEGFNIGHYYPTGAQYFTNEGKLLHPDVYEPTYQTDLAIAFMKRNVNHPFYCYLSWGPPHAPYNPPKDWDLYDPAKMEWRPNVPDDVRNDSRNCKRAAGYYGSCSALDHELGRLMKSLDETGLAGRTLVVFTADHGDMLGSHGCYQKSKPEDESLHVPLFMRLPGRIRGNQVTPVLSSSIDLAPTILSICGVKGLPNATGRDLSGAVLGGTTPKVDSVYSEGRMREWARPETMAGRKVKKKKKSQEEDADVGATGVSGGMEWRSLVTPTHKLVVRVDTKVGALFDLEKDPYELKNLAGERSLASLQADLLARMKLWGKDTGDPFPEVSPAARPSYTDAEAEKAKN
jgi:arylsulfatase A-like enzyme